MIRSFQGLQVSIVGATLLDLLDRLGVLQEDIVIILMGKCMGFMMGAIIGGFLFRIFYKKADVMMLCALVVAAVAVGCMPQAPSLILLAGLYTIVGVAEGISNVGEYSTEEHYIF